MNDFADFFHAGCLNQVLVNSNVEYQDVFPSSSVKLLMKELDFAIFRYFDMFIVTKYEWFTKDTHSRVCIIFQCVSEQSKAAVCSCRTYTCVCLHPPTIFFVCNTTGALETVGEHDQMNTEPLISQQRENMLPSNRHGRF